MQALHNSAAFPMALRDPWLVPSEQRCFLAAMRPPPELALHSTALNQKDSVDEVTGFQHCLPHSWESSH